MARRAGDERERLPGQTTTRDLEGDRDLQLLASLNRKMSASDVQHTLPLRGAGVAPSSPLVFHCTAIWVVPVTGPSVAVMVTGELAAVRPETSPV